MAQVKNATIKMDDRMEFIHTHVVIYIVLVAFGIRNIENEKFLQLVSCIKIIMQGGNVRVPPLDSSKKLKISYNEIIVVQYSPWHIPISHYLTSHKSIHFTSY